MSWGINWQPWNGNLTRRGWKVLMRKMPWQKIWNKFAKNLEIFWVKKKIWLNRLERCSKIMKNWRSKVKWIKLATRNQWQTWHKNWFRLRRQLIHYLCSVSKSGKQKYKTKKSLWKYYNCKSISRNRTWKLWRNSLLKQRTIWIANRLRRQNKDRLLINKLSSSKIYALKSKNVTRLF